MQKIYDLLEKLDIDYHKEEHPAVFTCEDSVGLRKSIPGDTKNLFLRNKKGNAHYLVTLGHNKQADLKALQEKLGESKLSFGSPERLMRKLGVEPGSVSLLGIANNEEHDVQVIIDEDLWKNDIIACHPCINTATLHIKRGDLQKFLDAMGNPVKIVLL